MTNRYVGYVRVSTTRQGCSGLGLSAQYHRIKEFVGTAGEIAAWYEEHESGAKADRLELERALTTCELTGATLVVATLDRLSRDVMFLETVKRRCADGGFEFRCCDMPDANSFMLGVMAQMAQYERERISERTSAALQAAKRRGVKLGGPLGAQPFEGKRDIGAKRAGVVHKAKADEWAEKRKPLIAELVAAGHSNSAVARELTARGVNTRRGGDWTATGVSRIKARLGLIDDATIAEAA